MGIECDTAACVVGKILIDSDSKSSFQNKKLPSSFYELFINSWSSISTTHAKERQTRENEGKKSKSDLNTIGQFKE